MNDQSITKTVPAPAHLLVRLLKLGSFISGPMRDGVCDPAQISSNELRVIMALAGEGALANAPSPANAMITRSSLLLIWAGSHTPSRIGPEMKLPSLSSRTSRCAGAGTVLVMD